MSAESDPRPAAGRHVAADLPVPDNITVQTPPSHAPNAVRSILRQAREEDVWRFLHENGLGDRIFVFDEDILDQCRQAWHKLIARPWMITSLGLPPTAYRS